MSLTIPPPGAVRPDGEHKETHNKSTSCEATPEGNDEMLPIDRIDRLRDACRWEKDVYRDHSDRYLHY